MKIAADIVGREVGPDEQQVDKRWLMAYSAGLGETAYPHALFPVCYEWPATRLLRERAGLVPIDARLVHAQHDLIIHRPPREEKLFISGKVVAALQRKPGVLVVYRFETRDAKGEPVSTTDFSALYRGAKLEGADRAIAALDDPPKHTRELREISQISVPATAAHVYTECARIWNPIHTDVDYARAAGLPDTILHGTATLALSVSRLRLKSVRRIRCRFAGMVTMPSTLTVHASREGDAITFETRNSRGETVIERGWIG
ncbi:MAG TPA: MaoC/PaaZ C-terminal domain-containing protein [Burkholderiales bacterium]|nr:MaoC/PaaZ C-terminal domain-containing protein [Burkholderiales bacterium]